MEELEANVLNYIINHGTFEEPVSSLTIKWKFNLSKRRLEMIIESLRVNFGHPIVAKKHNQADIIFHGTKKSAKQELHHIADRF